MANKSSASSFATSIGGSLFLLFLFCKLAGFVEWSWWWITAPLWLPLVLGGALIGLFILLGVVLQLCKPKRER